MAHEPVIKSFQKIERTLQCPFKFSTPENGLECVKSKCALWLYIQKACAIQVLARGFEPKRSY